MQTMGFQGYQESDIIEFALRLSSSKTAVFCVIATCSLAEVYQRYRPDNGGRKDLRNVGKLIRRKKFYFLNANRVLIYNLTVHSASQEMSLLLWTPLPAPAPSQINPIHTLQTYFPKIRFNIIFPAIRRSSEWLLHLGFPTPLRGPQSPPVHLRLFRHR